MKTKKAKRPSAKKARTDDFSDRRSLNAQEAARYIEISYSTFIGIVKAGEIPHRKLGRRYIFSHEVLDRWLKGDMPLYKKVSLDK